MSKKKKKKGFAGSKNEKTTDGSKNADNTCCSNPKEVCIVF
jgi:hypothetical protein